MSKHTPGPWTFETFENGAFEVTGPGGHGRHNTYVVCSRNWHSLKDETHANARLIAAAPRMYEVIKRGAMAGDAECLSIMAAIDGSEA